VWHLPQDRLQDLPARSDVSRRPLNSHRGKLAFLGLLGTCWDERPETWVTRRTGHIGNTFRLRAGDVYAVEGVFGDERALAVCGEVARGRIDDRGLPGVWHLPQDRLQASQIESLIVTLKREKPHWAARRQGFIVVCRN